MRLHRIKALLLKYWYFSINSLDRIFDIVYWPLITILFFGFTTAFIDKSSDIPNIVLFLLGGLILWNLFQRVQQDVSVYLMEDFWSRNLSNMFSTPVKESEIFVAVSLFGVMRAVLSFFVMTTLALFAYRFNIYQGGFAALLFGIPLFLFAWGLGIAVAGLIFRYGTRIQVFAWSISFLFQPIAAVTYPITILPVWLQKIAFATPLYYTFEGFRTAYLGSFSYTLFFIAIGLGVVYMILGYLLFVSSVRRAKRTGLITYY